MSELRQDTGKIFKHERDNAGNLRCWLSVSKVGPLTYRNDDGSARIEHVDTDSLFDGLSLSTAWGKPITHLHPKEGEVTPDNAREHQRGTTMESIAEHGDILTILGVVHDAETIKLIEGGTNQVSAGYTCEVVPRKDGSFDQRDRRYNHFSIVPFGRAGATVKAHVDGSETVLRCDAVTDADQTLAFPQTPQPMTITTPETRTVKLDGIGGVPLPPDVAAAVTQLKERNDGLTTKVDQLKTDKAGLETKLDALKTKLDEAQANHMDAEAIATNTADRVDAWLMVEPVLRKDDKDFKRDPKLDASGIKRLYLEKVRPDTLKRVDAYQSDAEKRVALDMAFEQWRPDSEESRNDANRRTDDLYGQLNQGRNQSAQDSATDPVEKARLDAAERKSNAYKGKSNASN